MFLSKSEFSQIVKNTPLISIDLCIFNGKDLLIGKRKNPPAKDFFFVPGGRIFKLEPRKNALKRILKNELGFELKNKNIKLKDLGIYEHFYEDNFLDNKEFSTHYIVNPILIPYESLVKIKGKIKSEQHSKYKWINVNNLFDINYKIHNYTLKYLRSPILRNYLN